MHQGASLSYEEMLLKSSLDSLEGSRDSVVPMVPLSSRCPGSHGSLGSQVSLAPRIPMVPQVPSVLFVHKVPWFPWLPWFPSLPLFSWFLWFPWLPWFHWVPWSSVFLVPRIPWFWFPWFPLLAFWLSGSFGWFGRVAFLVFLYVSMFYNRYEESASHIFAFKRECFKFRKSKEMQLNNHSFRLPLYFVQILNFFCIVQQGFRKYAHASIFGHQNAMLVKMEVPESLHEDPVAFLSANDLLCADDTLFGQCIKHDVACMMIEMDDTFRIAS